MGLWYRKTVCFCPGSAVKLYFSVRVVLYTAFSVPKNPRQKPWSEIWPKIWSKIWPEIQACRPCIKNPAVRKTAKIKKILQKTSKRSLNARSGHSKHLNIACRKAPNSLTTALAFRRPKKIKNEKNEKLLSNFLRSIFLIFGLWTPELVTIDLNIGFYVKFPAWRFCLLVFLLFSLDHEVIREIQTRNS